MRYSDIVFLFSHMYYENVLRLQFTNATLLIAKTASISPSYQYGIIIIIIITIIIIIIIVIIVIITITIIVIIIIIIIIYLTYAENKYIKSWHTAISLVPLDKRYSWDLLVIHYHSSNQIHVLIDCIGLIDYLH